MGYERYDASEWHIRTLNVNGPCALRAVFLQDLRECAFPAIGFLMCITLGVLCATIAPWDEVRGIAMIDFIFLAGIWTCWEWTEQGKFRMAFYAFCEWRGYRRDVLRYKKDREALSELLEVFDTLTPHERYRLWHVTLPTLRRRREEIHGFMQLWRCRYGREYFRHYESVHPRLI